MEMTLSHATEVAAGDGKRNDHMSSHLNSLKMVILGNI